MSENIYTCPKCQKPLTFNYASDKVLDLNDTPFLEGACITSTTTLGELKEIEMQSSDILYCEECEIDVVVSGATAYQDKPPIEQMPEEKPELPQKQDEKGQGFWEEWTTPSLLSKLHDKLHSNWATGFPLSDENLDDCRNIVCALMDRQHNEEAEECQHEYQLHRTCGVQVCVLCGDHKGLARCFCGWGLAPGERLEDDVEY